MEEKGLVRRTRGLEKKNLVRISLKDKEKQALELSSDTKVIPRILSSLSEEQRQQLITCLEIVRAKALKELGIKKEPPFPVPMPTG